MVRKITGKCDLSPSPRDRHVVHVHPKSATAPHAVVRHPLSRASRAKAPPIRRMAAPGGSRSHRASGCATLRAMSIYRTLDEGPTSEMSVQREVIKRKRSETRPRVPSATTVAAQSLRRSSPSSEPLPNNFTLAESP